MNDITLYKPNELISIISELELNRTARHLFNYFLRHAQKKIKFENYKGYTFEINLNELNDLANINQKNYKLLSKALDNLMKPVTLLDDPKHIHKVVPIYEVFIDVEQGVYRYKLADTIIELLRNTDYFTKLNLQEFNPLKSKHSLVIFELIKRYEKAIRIPLITIDELRKITDTLNKKTYDNFTNIKDKILDIAIAEINEKTDYIISYEIKKERAKTRPKVYAIQFFFSKKSASSGIDLNVTKVTEKQMQNVAKNEDLYAKNNSLQRNAHVFDELYLDFCKKFKDLSVKDYEFALNTYEVSTLRQFLNDMQKYSSLSSDKFLIYLEDRTSKGWANYTPKKEKTPDEEIANMMNMLRPRK